MSSRATLAFAVASCNEGELLEGCLAASVGFDEVVVFDLESTDRTIAIAQEYGARIIRLDRPPFIELIRERQLSELSADWILFADPDEVLPEGWLDAARGVVESAAADVAAFWVAYREVAFGAPLEHTRLGAAKISLVRRSLARGVPTEIARPHDSLVLSGQVGAAPGSLPLIKHYGYRSVAESITKLSRYAVNGGVGAESSSSAVPGPLTAIKMLWGSVVMSRAYKDGPAGISVASMSAIGDYLGLLQRWDEGGRPHQELGRIESISLSTGRWLHRTQWRLRSSFGVVRRRRSNDSRRRFGGS